MEPMQIDADPQEDPQNAPDTNYTVENPTLVSAIQTSYTILMVLHGVTACPVTIFLLLLLRHKGLESQSDLTTKQDNLK